MKKRLLLVNLCLDENMFRPGRSTITLSYMAEALGEKYNVELCPAKEYHRNDSCMEREVMNSALIANIIGISSNTFSSFYARRMAWRLPMSASMASTG